MLFIPQPRPRWGKLSEPHNRREKSPEGNNNFSKPAARQLPKMNFKSGDRLLEPSRNHHYHCYQYDCYCDRLETFRMLVWQERCGLRATAFSECQLRVQWLTALCREEKIFR